MNSLTVSEQQRYVELNQVIGDNLEAFFSVGAALLEVQEGKLYRAEFPSFQAYCLEKWGIGRNYGYRLVSAARVAENVAPKVLTIGQHFQSKSGKKSSAPAPQNERQIRPLSRLPAAQQRKAWQAAVKESGGSQPTAAQVSSAVSAVVVKEIPQKYHKFLEGLSQNEQAAVWQWAKKLWPAGDVPAARLAGEVARRRGKGEQAIPHVSCPGCQNDTFHLTEDGGQWLATCARCGRVLARIPLD